MADLLLKFLEDSTAIYKFSEEELKTLAIEFFLKYVTGLPLLRIWEKLPEEYRSEFNLQIRLPCFIHYNRPDWHTHVDGPPTSQSNCYLCLEALK